MCYREIVLILSVLKAVSVYYPSNTTSAPSSVANLSSSIPPRKCYQEGSDSWYCSCSSLCQSLASPSVYSTTDTYSNNGTPVVWSGSWTLSVLNPAYTAPEACYSSCNIRAADVRLLYWPVDADRNGTHPNTTTSFSAYTLTSDNFEL